MAQIHKKPVFKWQSGYEQLCHKCFLNAGSTGLSSASFWCKVDLLLRFANKLAHRKESQYFCRWTQ